MWWILPCEEKRLYDWVHDAMGVSEMVHFKASKATLKNFVVRAFCLMMVTIAVLSAVAVPAANAVGSKDAAAVVNERAAAELDKFAGAGTSDQLEGAVDSVTGKAKRDIGRVKDGLDLDSTSDKLDGATDSLKGKVKRDVGRTKSAAEDLGDDIEDSANSVVDSIKDLFD